MPVDVVFGGASFGNREGFNTDEEVAAVFAILKKNNIKRIDSAQIYQNSQATLGRVQAADQFIIDTKWGSPNIFANPPAAWATKEYIVESAKKSIETLGVKQVDIFYLHFPDALTPIEETIDGVNEVYKLGLFKRFGLSNFKADGVQKVYDYAAAKGYVLPTVFQGQYNPIVRNYETELFPTLRALNIAFFAYSPLAGGLLTKTVQDFNDGKGRFQKGGIFYNIYNKPEYLNSLARWEAAARSEGVPAAELAYRWVAWHSELSEAHGDALITGASSPAQVGETLEWIAKGKLSDSAVAAIDSVWEGVKADTAIEV